MQSWAYPSALSSLPPAPGTPWTAEVQPSPAEACGEFGYPVRPVLGPHPPGTLEQAHAVQPAPEHLDRPPVIGFAEPSGQRTHAPPHPLPPLPLTHAPTA